jgi:hypothetical protein
VHDGRIPAEWVARAAKALGTYAGTFAQKPVSASLAIEGANRPVLQVSRDVAGLRCDSRIGALESITLRKDGEKVALVSVAFDFDPGNCTKEILGRQIHLNFAYDEQENVSGVGFSYLYDYRTLPVCDSPTHEDPIPFCRDVENQPYYKESALLVRSIQ